MVVKTHPVMEVVAKSLFGIVSVAMVNQKSAVQMVNRAAKSAANKHDEIVSKYEQFLDDIETHHKINNFIDEKWLLERVKELRDKWQ